MSSIGPSATLALILTCGAAGEHTDAFRVTQSGRLEPLGPGDMALEHEDGDAVGLMLHAPCSSSATTMRRAWSCRSALRSAIAGSPAPGSAALGSGFELQFVSCGLGVEGDIPTAAAFTPDGLHIVVAHRDSLNLIVFDANTRDVLQTIALSGSPNAVAIDSDGLHAVTANIFEDTASIVDLTAGQETAVIPVGDQPGLVAVAPGGGTAAVGNTVSGEISVIDIASATETDRIGGLQFASSTSINFETGVAASTFRRFEFASPTVLLLPERFNNRVQFVNIATGTVTPLTTAANPDALDVSPDGTTAVVSHGSSTQLVTRINVAGQSIAQTYPVGANLFAAAIAINPAKTKAIVGLSNEVRVVDLVSGAVSGNVNTLGVNDILATADGQFALVIGFNGALVSFASGTVVANVNAVVSTERGAVSPTGPRAALIGGTFTEELLVVNTNGAGGFLEERVPSGPPPEGDRAREVAITPDGQRALATNILSDTVSVVDLASRQVSAIVAVGNRPSETAIDPGGERAAVANLDSTFLTVIDLVTLATTPVTISTRASQVEISPSGQFAYAAVVAEGDGVWRVNLDTLSVQGPKITTGNMGSIGMLYQQSSGMTLSHSGATLVTCNSFDDNISIINTATWTEVLRPAVGDMPVRAVFSPDDERIYVSNQNSDTVSILSNAGPGSAVIGTIAVGDMPFELAVAPAGNRLFVGNFNSDSISIVNLPGTMVNDTVFLTQPVQDLAVDAAGARVYAAGGDWSVSIGPGALVQFGQSGEFAVIDAANGDVLELIDTDLPVGNMALRDEGPLAAIASPHGDGLGLLAPPSCPGDVDGDGAVNVEDLTAVILAWGTSDRAADQNGDGTVDVADLVLVIVGWGAC